MPKRVTIPISSGAAAESQVDQMQNMVNAIAFASIVIILADAAAENQVTFLGLTTELSGAYAIAAFAFIFAILVISQLFARLADMVNLTDDEDAPEVLARLFNHRWSLNPFSYFGHHLVAVLHASFGMGLLVFIWWLGLTALAQLWNRTTADHPGIVLFILWYAYSVAGFLALTAMLHVQRVIDLRLKALAGSSGDTNLEPLRRSLRHIARFKYVVGIVFAALGCGVFYVFTHIGA